MSNLAPQMTADEAVRSEERPGGRAYNHLHFVVGDEQYCADLNRILKVVLLVELRKVPMRPGYLPGLMNYGGNIIPVIDLASRLHLDVNTPYDVSTPIIICSHNGNEVGMIVSSVLDVIQVREQDIQLGPMFDDYGPPCLGVIHTKRQQSFILDLDRVLTVDMAESAVAGAPV